MRKKILFNKFRPSLIYPLAFLRFDVDKEEDLIPADVNYLLNNPPEPDEELIILDIGPETEKQAGALTFYLDDYSNRIKFYLDYHLWGKERLSYINREREVVSIYHEPSCSTALKRLGYELNYRYVRLADLLADPDKWLKDSVTQRLMRAYLVTSVFCQNTGTEYYRQEFFEKAINETLYDKRDKDIQGRHLFYDEMTSLLKTAIQRITLNSFLSDEAKKRLVGYVDLGEINEYFNLGELVSAGLKTYPWLFVVQYNYQHKAYADLYSRQLPVKKLLYQKDHTLRLGKEDAIKAIRERTSNW